MKILFGFLAFSIYFALPTEAYNICTCQCCYSGICLDRPNSAQWNGTFQVQGCDQCTKALCFELIKKPDSTCDEVAATCIDYDTYWRLAVIVVLILAWIALLIIGCLRDLPFFHSIWLAISPQGAQKLDLMH